MADDDFPIDINYGKITDWLVDRKFLPRDWRPRLAALQEQASAAARELSHEHAALLRPPWEKEDEVEGEEAARSRAKASASASVSASASASATTSSSSSSSSSPAAVVVVDHPAAVRVRDALVSRPETATKSLLGRWTGQAGTWDKICRAYARGGGGGGSAAPPPADVGGALAVAEAALALSRAVDFEIPALRASTSRGHQTLRDLERRAAEADRQAAAAAKEYGAERASLGIRPVAASSLSSSSSTSLEGPTAAAAAAAVDAELRDLVRRELRPLLRRAVEALKSADVGAGVGHYSSFVRYAHCGGGGGGGGVDDGNGGSSNSKDRASPEALLPALAAVRGAVLEENGEKERQEEEEEDAAMATTAATATAAAAAAGGDAAGISWDIDVSSSGSAACEDASASASPPINDECDGEASGGISWDIETVGGAEDDDGVASAAAAGASVASDDEKKPSTPGDKGKSNHSSNEGDNILSKLATDASARAALGDDIAELSAFLSQRLAVVRGGVGGIGVGVNGVGAFLLQLPPDAPAALKSFYASPSSASEVLQAALDGLRSAEEFLSGERTSTLLLLGNPSGRGFGRLAARLRARAGAEGKFRRAAAAALLRAGDVRKELASDAKNLRRAAAAARDARVRAEAGISSMIGFGGGGGAGGKEGRRRKVNVVGEVSAAIAAAEAATGG